MPVDIYVLKGSRRKNQTEESGLRARASVRSRGIVNKQRSVSATSHIWISFKIFSGVATKHLRLSAHQNWEIKSFARQRRQTNRQLSAGRAELNLLKAPAAYNRLACNWFLRSFAIKKKKEDLMPCASRSSTTVSHQLPTQLQEAERERGDGCIWFHAGRPDLSPTAATLLQARCDQIAGDCVTAGPDGENWSHSQSESLLSLRFNISATYLFPLWVFFKFLLYSLHNI